MITPIIFDVSLALLFGSVFSFFHFVPLLSHCFLDDNKQLLSGDLLIGVSNLL